MSISLKVKGEDPVTMSVKTRQPVEMSVREAVPVGGFSVEIDNETLILKDGVLQVDAERVFDDLNEEQLEKIKGEPGTSVTITKITESSASGGSNVVEFSDGNTLIIKNGKDGKGGSGNAEQNEHAANLSNVGFIRTSNGSFTTTETGRRTDFIPTDGVTRISGVVGFYSACVTVGFYSAANQSAYLPDISIPGTAFLAAGANYGDGGFEIEIDLTDEKYADAKYFVVSSYRNTAQAGYYTLAVDFSDDYCKYANGEVVEEEPRYRISKNTVAFFGDSITAGGYPELIASITGATVSNHAVGGATVASGTANVTHIVEQIVAYTGNDDIICISGGLNDYYKEVPLGTLTAGYSDALDTTTVMGALEAMFRKLFTDHPTAKLYFVITHKAAGTEIKPNEDGLTFEDYHDAIVRVLEKYSIPFYDAYSDSGLISNANTPWGESINNLYTTNADATHPNEDGYLKYYVYQIISLLEHGIGSSKQVSRSTLVNDVIAALPVYHGEVEDV